MTKFNTLFKNNNINNNLNYQCEGCLHIFNNKIDHTFHSNVCLHLYMKKNDICINNEQLNTIIQLLTLYNYFISTNNIKLLKQKNKNINDNNILQYCDYIDDRLYNNNSNILEILSKIFNIELDVLQLIVKHYIYFKSNLMNQLKMY
jgi:hypothetical protein